MPRSFLVKSVRSESGKTSYQKLRDVYTETAAATTVKALAPFTPPDYGQTVDHGYVPEHILHQLSSGANPTDKVMESDRHSMRSPDASASEPTVGLQSRSPDATMQAGGFSHSFGPRDYPPKKRPRDPIYETAVSRQTYCYDVLQSERMEHDEVTMSSRDFTEPDDVSTRAHYDQIMSRVTTYDNIGNGGSPDYLMSVGDSTSDFAKNTFSFCGDFNGNTVPKSHIFQVSNDPVDNSPKKRTTTTIDYTLDAFLVSDGRSKRKNNPSSPLDKSGKQRYSCVECGKHYATSSNLSRHKQTHRSLESKLAKKCPHCDKVYVSMPALSMHVLTHELRHNCHVCNKAFSRPWLLQGHLRSHTGERPFGCAHCGKAFADRSNLRAHMQTHSTFKNYSCERCHKTFALKSYLNKHYESACVKDEREIESSHCTDMFIKEI